MRKLIFVLTALSLFSCGGKKNGNESGGEKIVYPDKWEKDMAVEIGYGGGMSPDWYTIYISYDSSYMESGAIDITNKWYFSMVSDYLDSLAVLIRDNDIASIESEDAGGTIYDKGTTHLTLTMGGKTYKMEDSAVKLIKGENGKKFRAVFDFIYMIANNEVNKLSSVFYFLPDKKLLAARPNITISEYDFSTSYSSEESGLVDSIYMFLLPGKHRFTINIIDSLGKIEPFDTVWDCTISPNAKEFVKINFNKGKVMLDSIQSATAKPAEQ